MVHLSPGSRSAAAASTLEHRGQLTNAAIAQALDELGDLYELDGADSYRVIAYRNAARSVRDAAVSVAEMVRPGGRRSSSASARRSTRSCGR